MRLGTTLDERLPVDLAAGPRLTARQVLFGMFLAGTSGLAILGYAFAGVPMTMTVPFVTMPAAAAIVTIVLLRRHLYGRLRLFGELLMRGAAWGFVATIAYDVVRPLVTYTFRFAFDPFMAIAVFGYYITGLPTDDPRTLAVGWAYHAWNGISFGMTYALLRPAGGLLTGWAWGLGLQVLMMIVYPEIFQIRLSTPGFVPTGVIGHSVWGLVLGAGLRWQARRMRVSSFKFQVSGLGFHVRSSKFSVPGSQSKASGSRGEGRPQT